VEGVTTGGLEGAAWVTTGGLEEGVAAGVVEWVAAGVVAAGGVASNPSEKENLEKNKTNIKIPDKKKMEYIFCLFIIITAKEYILLSEKIFSKDLKV
jgi:hypothetical protein